MLFALLICDSSESYATFFKNINIYNSFPQHVSLEAHAIMLSCSRYNKATANEAPSFIPILKTRSNNCTHTRRQVFHESNTEFRRCTHFLCNQNVFAKKCPIFRCIFYCRLVLHWYNGISLWKHRQIVADHCSCSILAIFDNNANAKSIINQTTVYGLTFECILRCMYVSLNWNAMKTER